MRSAHHNSLMLKLWSMKVLQDANVQRLMFFVCQSSYITIWLFFVSHLTHGQKHGFTLQEAVIHIMAAKPRLCPLAPHPHPKQIYLQMPSWLDGHGCRFNAAWLSRLRRWGEAVGKLAERPCCGRTHKTDSGVATRTGKGEITLAGRSSSTKQISTTPGTKAMAGMAGRAGRRWAN